MSEYNKNWYKDYPDLIVKDGKFKTNYERFIRNIEKTNASYFVNKTSDTATVVIKGTEYKFKLRKSFPQEKMNLFKMVKVDAEKWLEENPNYTVPKGKASQYNGNYTYLDVDEVLSIGVDIKHAFWRIAYVNGIISKNTYNYGLDDEIDCKAIRLASISVLGREKSYYRYRDGKRVGDKIVVRPKNEKLNGIFHFVRNSCYWHMAHLMKKLGNDFLKYVVDEIHFYNTDENLEMVLGYLDQKDLLWTLLTEKEDDKD